MKTPLTRHRIKTPNQVIAGLCEKFASGASRQIINPVRLRTYSARDEHCGKWFAGRFAR